MNRELLQQALAALMCCAAGNDVSRGLKREAIAALRSALAAPQPEPVALESVHLTRDTRGMCIVRVNGRVAIRDNGDIINHMATLEWFAAPPAAPAPADMVMVPREPTPEQISAIPFPSNVTPRFGVACYRAMIAAAPAPAVPEGEIVITTDEDGVIVSVTRQNEEGRIISVLAESTIHAAPAVRELQDNDCTPNHLCKGRMVHLPRGEQCDRCGHE